MKIVDFNSKWFLFDFCTFTLECRRITTAVAMADILSKCRDDTFADLFGDDEEEIANDLRREHWRLVRDRIGWLARITVMLYPRVLVAEGDFRRACIDNGVARHGRTECMLLQWLCDGGVHHKTCQRWADNICVGYGIVRNGGQVDDVAAAIKRLGGIEKTHQAYRDAHPEMAQPKSRKYDVVEAGDGEDADHRGASERGRYIVTPPEILAEFGREFGRLTDVCPYPRSPDWDALTMPWDPRNYLNPPFAKRDGGPMAFLRKAIAEQQLGKTTVGIISATDRINLLLEAGAELRSAGRLRWLNTITGKPMPSPPAAMIFILRGKTDAAAR